MFLMHRFVGEWFYFVMGLFALFSFYLLYKRRLLRFGAICYALCTLLLFSWEISLIGLGFRSYIGGFNFYLQLLYQSFTEFAPHFVISLFIMDYFKLISLDRFGDKNAGRN